MLQRLAQERLGQFAETGQFAVRLVAHLEAFVVEIAVSDAGPGFMPEQRTNKGARLGLIGMRDRVASLGGTFDLTSQPGNGTRLTARFEVTEEAPRGQA